MIRFHDAWLEDPALRDWVVKVSNDESRAYCRWCQIVLRAHKADLTTHSNTAKHAKNTESANLNGSISAGPIYVQIVPSDEQNSANQLALPRDSYSSELVKPSSYSKRFRPEWQELPELKDWLEPCEDPRKAYCRMCDVQLRAHRHDLLLHGRSTKHKRASSQATPAITASSSSSSTPATSNNNNNLMSGEVENDMSSSELVDTKLSPTEYDNGMIQNMVDDDDLPIKKCRMELTEPSDGMHHHQHQNILSNDTHQQLQHHHHQEHILPEETHTDIHGDEQDEEEGDEGETDPIEIDKPPTQINVIRIVDSSKKTNQFVYQTPNTLRIGNSTQSEAAASRLRGRRPRITASDVIRAIDMNEFTGYEMLQILKKIAPRL